MLDTTYKQLVRLEKVGS